MRQSGSASKFHWKFRNLFINFRFHSFWVVDCHYLGLTNQGETPGQMKLKIIQSFSEVSFSKPCVALARYSSPPHTLFLFVCAFYLLVPRESFQQNIPLVSKLWKVGFDSRPFVTPPPDNRDRIWQCSTTETKILGLYRLTFDISVWYLLPHRSVPHPLFMINSLFLINCNYVFCIDIVDWNDMSVTVKTTYLRMFYVTVPIISMV